MIKANELRIGNWVLEKLIRGDVRRDNFFQIDAGWFSAYSMKMSSVGHEIPIELTPEILEACGFEDSIESDYHLDKIELNAIDNEFIFEYFDLRVKYLHQLQNLYFAINGEELMIDEQKLKRSVATTAK